MSHFLQIQLRKIAKFVLALSLLFLMLYLGKLLSILFPIGIPDSIWGLLLLFVLLLLKIIKVQWIFPASRPLLRYMTVFFLPICSGIVDQTALLSQHLGVLIMANFVSTVLSLVLVGFLAQWLFNRGKVRE